MKLSMGGGCCTQLMPIKALPCQAAATMLSIGGCFMQPKPISASLIRLGGR